MKRYTSNITARPRGSVSSAGSVGSGLVARGCACARLWVGLVVRACVRDTCVSFMSK